MVIHGKAKNESSSFVVDLKQSGYDKLLSRGRPTRKYRISVQSASQKAVAKIESAGGEVTIKNSIKNSVVPGCLQPEPKAREIKTQ